MYDYYQENVIGPGVGKSGWSCPTFMYEIEVTRSGLPISLVFSQNVQLERLKILGPDGRVVSSRTRFVPQVTGKHTIKYWITSNPSLYTLDICPHESVGKHQQKTYTNLGISREGSLLDPDGHCKNQNFSFGTHAGTHKGAMRHGMRVSH